MKQIKRGFTLIELLAVIVIITIIFLVTFPIINTIIEKVSLEAEKNSVEGIISAIENTKIYTDNNDYNGTELLKNMSYKGKNPDEITLKIKNESNYITRIIYGENCYVKINDEKIVMYSKDECPTYNYSNIFKINNSNIQEIINNESGINLSESADYIDGKIIENDGINIFQGTDPANYLVYGNSCFRIISYDDNNIKIIYDGANDYQIDSNPCSHMYNGSIGRMTWSGLIGESKFGTNQEWLDINNPIRLNFENTINDETINSDDDIILGDETQNIIKISKEEKKYLKKNNYYIGGISEESTTLVSEDSIDNIESQEQEEIYNNYIGLLSLSEYLNASSDNNCKNYKIEDNNCNNNNFIWKYYISNDIKYTVYASWTANKIINQYNEVVAYYPYMTYNYNYNTNFKIRPVFTLKGDTIFTGTGTYFNPYRIANIK